MASLSSHRLIEDNTETDVHGIPLPASASYTKEVREETVYSDTVVCHRSLYESI